MYPNVAAIGDWYGTDLIEVTDDLKRLDESGFWFVAGWFEGPVLGFRFANWSHSSPRAGEWVGPQSWASDADSNQYVEKVAQAKSEIAAGNVYEVNVCRQLSAAWPTAGEDDSLALYQYILREHPSEYAAYLRVNSPSLLQFGLPRQIEIVSASPECFLKVDARQIRSTPIKGTAATNEDFLEKDISENIMIVDLVRNDLSQVCELGSIEVEDFLRRVEIPNISHLVTTIRGNLQSHVGWSAIFAHTFPPGSVTGAPKYSALKLIKELETPRNIYCGTLGRVDADAGSADLSVAIRTFWRDGNQIRFGTGAGITWGSEPLGEWNETELKSQRLVALASTRVSGANDVE